PLLSCAAPRRYTSVRASVANVYCAVGALDLVIRASRNRDSTRRRDSIISNALPDASVVDLTTTNVASRDVTLKEDIDLLLMKSDSRRHDNLETPSRFESSVESLDLVEHVRR